MIQVRLYDIRWIYGYGYLECVRAIAFGIPRAAIPALAEAWDEKIVFLPFPAIPVRQPTFRLDGRGHRVGFDKASRDYAWDALLGLARRKWHWITQMRLPWGVCLQLHSEPKEGGGIRR